MDLNVNAGGLIATMRNGTKRYVQCSYFVVTSQLIMEAWEAEVHTLTVRKQKHWKGILSDERKQRSMVRYIQDIFQCRMNDAEISKLSDFKLPSNGWASVISDAQHRELTTGTDSAYVIKAMGLQDDVVFLQFTCLHTSDVMMQIMGENNTFKQDALDRLQVDSHTGQHKRNQKVRVPVQPGEPLRA